MLKNHSTILKIGYSLHTSSICDANAGKVLRKIMGATKKKKFYVDDTPILPSTSTTLGKSFVSKVTGNPRRSNILNKLFMRHVTDIMATGDYSEQILGYGIEVNKVKVTPDYKFLRVYWIAAESGKQDEIEDLLKKSAGHLRNELSTLRVMGSVPNIVFVKDKNYCKIFEIEEKLKHADFGDDYEPPDLIEQYQSEFEILTSLDLDTKNKLNVLESGKQDGTLENDLGDIPPMPQDVLGLDHADILRRINKGMSKSKAPHRLSTDASEWAQWSEFKTTQSVNEDPVTFANHQEQRNAFKNFLQQRQILRMKQCKDYKNWTADMEYLEEEFRERKELALLNREPEEDDYVLEEDQEFVDK
ncbi:unnamed protein product [Ceutorhynchus assimilis]|uniref:Ribosome-binding factor A, mitochondrial n=1 Tax=Ceutorhynchus assimilis TaxID=467358 RepID=A0A9N9QMX6_9CUCU|nr:unnamed protein product [Ceutorhynchus assimilis]